MILLTTLVFPAVSYDGPSVSSAPLTDDQMAVYRVFLNAYGNGGPKTKFNLARRSTPLVLKDEVWNGCLKGITLVNLKAAQATVHDFGNTGTIAWPESVALVDPKAHWAQVAKGSASGLLTLSEIAFDRDHRYAVMAYGFTCGGLCGEGGTLVFEKRDGEWKRLDRGCTFWVA
jgi:hypothetical protein